jgi:hypothetical protein
VGAFYSIQREKISKHNLRNPECAPGWRRNFRLRHFLSRERDSAHERDPLTLASVLGDALCIVRFVMHPAQFIYVLDRFVSRDSRPITTPQPFVQYATELSKMARPPPETTDDPWAWDGAEAKAVRAQVPLYLAEMNEAIIKARARAAR